MRGPDFGPLPPPFLGLMKAVIRREHGRSKTCSLSSHPRSGPPAVLWAKLPHPLLVPQPFLLLVSLPIQLFRALLLGCSDSAARLAPRWCPSLPSVVLSSLSAPFRSFQVPSFSLCVRVAVSVTQPSAQSGSLSPSLSHPLFLPTTHTHTHTHTHSCSASLQQ